MKRLFFILTLVGGVSLFAGGINYCLERGGIYTEDNVCLLPDRTVCEVPAFPQDIKIEGWGKCFEDVEGYCEDYGKIFPNLGKYDLAIKNAYCRPMTDEEVKAKAERELAGKEFGYEGYWVYYGTGPYDWVYVSKGGGLVAALKQSDNGIDFITLDLTAEIKDGKIKFKK